VYAQKKNTPQKEREEPQNKTNVTKSRKNFSLSFYGVCVSVFCSNFETFQH
jgi:hypothetical protein